MTLSRGTHRQESAVLDFIRAYRLEHGHRPTYVEIAVGIGLSKKSKSAVHGIVLVLERSGKIRRLPDKARSIELIPASPILSIELPPHLYHSVQDLARKAKVTPEAVAIEAIRDGFAALRSKTVLKTANCETSGGESGTAPRRKTVAAVPQPARG